MPSLYKQADVMFISLKPTTFQHLEQTIPARLQSYIAAGKPVVGMIGEGAANLIKEIDCGICVDAGACRGVRHKNIADSGRPITAITMGQQCS